MRDGEPGGGRWARAGGGSTAISQGQRWAVMVAEAKQGEREKAGQAGPQQ